MIDPYDDSTIIDYDVGLYNELNYEVNAIQSKGYALLYNLWRKTL
jgi:hypothetical protein